MINKKYRTFREINKNDFDAARKITGLSIMFGLFILFIEMFLFSQFNERFLGGYSFLVAVALGVVINGIVLIEAGLHKYLYITKIQNTATTNIRGVAHGLVEISGKAIPIKEKYCFNEIEKSIICSVQIEYYSEKGRLNYYKDMLKEEFKENFYLEDETGRILVDLKDAEIYLKEIKFEGFLHKKQYNLIPRTLLPTHIKKYLIKEKSELINNLQEAYFKITKKVLRKNEKIYIIGEVERINGKEIIKTGPEGILLISNNKEFEILSEYRRKAIIRILIGIIVLIMGLALNYILLLLIIN